MRLFKIKSLFVIGLLWCTYSSYAQQELSIEDSRNIATTPTFYSHKLKGSFKFNNVLGVPGEGLFSTIVGLRGWGDDSGGKAHELAFANNGMYLRSGYDSGWESWRKIILAHANGNVGIGTDNPREKLEVFEGTLRIGNSSFGQNENSSAKNSANFGSDRHGSLIIGSNVYLNNSIDGQTRLRVANSHPTMNGAAIVIPGNGQINQNSIVFHTTTPGFVAEEQDYDSPRLIIHSEGNVGIGTATPNEKLAVNGNIRAKEIKVEATNWPDYVFKKGYQLMPLKEVEQHIKQHGHLPDIPKAEQIEKEGLSVSEMNKLMMKKIEELTLHLIEKDKRIGELELLNKRFAELEHRLNAVENQKN